MPSPENGSAKIISFYKYTRIKKIPSHKPQVPSPKSKTRQKFIFQVLNKPKDPLEFESRNLGLLEFGTWNLPYLCACFSAFIMNLILDFGNTSKKLALFKDGELQKARFFAQVSEGGIHRFCSGHDIKAAILSTVVSEKESLKNFLKENFRFYELNEYTALPIKNLYKTPATLGNDRLACAVAAASMFPGEPVLVIDAGTCIKYDFVTSKGEYFGGAISPGLKMRLKALHFFTARLPLVEMKESVDLIGRNTENSIQSGALNGALAEVNDIILQYKKNNKGLKVILTGGDLAFFENTIKSRIFAVPHLVLQGLNLILNHNVNKKK
jgi:type III pantothenate kinase